MIAINLRMLGTRTVKVWRDNGAVVETVDVSLFHDGVEGGDLFNSLQEGREVKVALLPMSIDGQPLGEVS
jgi:hypothetical protein